MSRTLAWIMVLVAVIATTVAASAVDIDDEMRAPAARDQQWMQQAADDIGLVELSDALEEQVDAAEAAADLRAEQADQALLASLPTTSTLFTMDEDDMAQHVYVEAAMEAEAEAEAEAEKPKLKAKKAKTAKKASRKVPKVPTPANTDSTPTSDSLPLAAPSVPGQRDPASTLLRTPGPSAAAEDESVISGRIAKAAHHIATLAHEETKLAYEKAVAAQQQQRWSEAVARGRQSKKFERDLPPSQPQVPHPSSNGAVSNGDRNFNTLFPAATAASDNKAPSQNSDFQHRGRGDLYVDHTQMLEAGQKAEAEAEARVLVEADAVSDEAAEAETEEEWSAEAESEAYAEADSQDAAAEAVAAKAAAAEEEEAAGAPVTAQEPCAAQCEGAGLWKTAACQDCIVRGMVNGWIVKSVKEQQRGYNYVHFSRNQCVKYANELSLRGTPNVGAPFAACLFQKIHESCNL